MLPLQILKMDHVAVATWDAAEYARLYTEILPGRFVDGGDETQAGFRWLQFAYPGGKIEVIEPLDDRGFLYRFLTRRGPGLHHVTFYVPDLGAALPELERAGYRPVDTNLAHESWKEAFLHPRDTSGVLIQLAQSTPAEDPPQPRRPLADFINDRPGVRPPA
jgi:methylmalonyl-CoA epimerase